MSRLLARRLVPSPAMLVALLALMIAMSGTSYAAVTLAKNSVRSPHIVNGQVKAADLASSSVTTAKVQDGSLVAGDFAPGELPAGAEGPAGPPGVAGPAGPAGPQGIPGPVDTVTVVAGSAPVGVNGFGGATANCPAGMEAIGGGADAANVLTMVVTSSFPLVNNTSPILLPAGQHPAATGWRVFMRNNGTSPASFAVMVVCAG
ncbi:MAG TPA: hypothetical protein VD864_16260 [Nocardioides sp.]|nr:hypothetical protein [Nocardioides sp.]